ncbi:hypothetical protein JR338_13070 (plasmid) [Chloroflexota bacterium]|nr:hypothetical protein JR338_13070 [Chloroflexota bacterium]
MKKILMVAVLLILISVLSACVPTEPQDVLAYCKETYESDFPDYPPAFIGACVAFWQSEKPTAFVSLCGSPAFRADLNADLGSDVQTRTECIALLRSLEE